MKVVEDVIAGGPEDFMEVTHLSLSGSNYEIGKYLAELARDRLSVVKTAWTDPLFTRAQRRFMRLNWPSHYERMRGCADAFGLDLNDDRFDFSFFWYHVGFPGCSVAYYPPAITENGHAILSRNFDYTTAFLADLWHALGYDFAGLEAGGGAKNIHSSVARPFLIEVFPDRGYPCMYMNAFDLLGTALDGINSEGLAVAIMTETVSATPDFWEPYKYTAVGLIEGQLPRFVLETCSTVAEAKEVLLSTHQSYTASPSHYLISDKSGDAFVWEYSPYHNVPRMTDCDGSPLVSTNHLIYDGAELVKTPMVEESVERLCLLKGQIDRHKGKHSRSGIRASNEHVQAVLPPGEGQYVLKDAAARTLWYSYYDQEERSLEIDFYLGETDGKLLRSSPKKFVLQQNAF